MAIKSLRSGHGKASSGSERAGRRRAATRATQPPRAALPENLQEAIEAERRNLAKAESVLGCLSIALEYDDTESTRGPYYPDVAEVARDLVRHSIDGLDSLALERHLARDRVKDACELIADLRLERHEAASIGWKHCPALPPTLEARGTNSHPAQ
jgi:hypothetical protein